MTNRLYITMLLAAALCLSCERKEPAVAFGIDTSDLSVFAEGGRFTVELSSSEPWTATSDNPWISVSPANGPSSANCTVSIDSTVTSSERNGIIRFRNRVTGDSRDISIRQDGYGYNISLKEQAVELSHFDFVDNRSFEVVVRSNVPFTVNIPESASKWLSCEEPDIKLERGARPRDIRLKFKWGINSVPLSREAMVSFIPDAGFQVEKADGLKVSQNAAPVIVPGHDGDSTVVLSMGRNLGLFNEMTSAEPMKDWDNVILWQEGDEGYTPEKEGRVKAAYFALFSTTEPIPYEVQYLTEAEELIIFSNVNSFLHDLELGEHICKLEKLKRLTVSAYGLGDLPQEFTNLRNLEWLDLSANNFDHVPDVLTPENFPKLHALMLNTCQRNYILDLSNTVQKDLAGLKGPFPRKLLEWEQLDTLRLSVNFIEGEMPDMEDYEIRYTEQDCTDMNLPLTMVGKPKVLPNAKYFAFNLNRMYGELPEWVLYHPNLTSWGPYALCYPQEGRASNGTAAAFSNVPVNMDYYWQFYDGYKEHVDIYLGD